MSTFTYSPVSHLYAPWPQTFDASSISRQAMPGGFATWFGQLTDGNSFWLTQSGTNIVAMTISDGTTDYVTATMALPAAPLEALLAAANNDPAAWTAYLLSAADTIVGSRAGDRLYAGAGNDDIGGGMGADTIYAGAGDDTVNGGDGIDTASYAGSKTAVIADLASGIADGEGHDTLIAIENVTGSAFADTLAGDAGANQMLGGAGDDTIAGGLGDDRLAGGRQTTTG